MLYLSITANKMYVKMTIVGILTFMGMINFMLKINFILSGVDRKKKFYNLKT